MLPFSKSNALLPVEDNHTIEFRKTWKNSNNLKKKKIISMVTTAMSIQLIYFDVFVFFYSSSWLFLKSVSDIGSTMTDFHLRFFIFDYLHNLYCWVITPQAYFD
jgi:hypothetical protein